MSHADEKIVRLHSEITALVPGVPDQIAVMDESAGDFGIAHYLGVDREPGLRPGFDYYGTTRDGIAVMTFDAGYIPEDRVIVHELGHALQDNTDGGDAYLLRSPLYPFWVERGLPGTPDSADAEAIRIAAARQFDWEYQSWRHWAVEIFGECFAACYVDAYQERTQTYGVSLDRERMRAFFQSLRSNYTQEDFVTDEEFLEKLHRLYTPRLQAQLEETVYKRLDTAQSDIARANEDIATHTHDGGETSPAKLAA